MQNFGFKPVSGLILGIMATDGDDAAAAATVAANRLFAQERRAAKDSVVPIDGFANTLRQAVENKTIASELDQAYDLVQESLAGHLGSIYLLTTVSQAIIVRGHATPLHASQERCEGRSVPSKVGCRCQG